MPPSAPSSSSLADLRAGRLRGMTPRITAPDDYRALGEKLRALRQARPSAQLEFARTAAERTVLKSIRGLMAASNISRKIIDGTSITRVEFAGTDAIRITASSVYFAAGFDVGKAREEGTRDHWVRPVRKKALHWISPESGKDRFSKGHVVSGLPPLRSVRTGLRRSLPSCRREYSRLLSDWAEKMLN